MSSPVVIPGDLIVRGAFGAGSMAVPANAIGDAEVTAARPISAAKLQQRFQTHASQTKTAGVSVAERRVIRVIVGATGTILSLLAGLQTALVGDATTTINLYKNGSSILTAALVLTSATAAYATAAASVATASLVVGDVLEIVITVAAGTGTLGQGLFVQLNHNEDAV